MALLLKPTKNTQVGIPSPNPSFPSLVNIVKGENSIKVQNKNLFNDTVERKSAYPNTQNTDIGKVVSYGNSTATYSYVNCSYVVAGQTYTLSWKQDTTPASTNTRIGVIVDENNIVLQKQNTWLNSTTKITFTPTYSGYFILATDIYATEIQLELGSTATSYITHAEQVYPINLGSIELSKIGNYQDKLFKAIEGDTVYDSLSSTQKEGLTSGKWYKYSAIGKVVLDGTETWTNSGTNSKNFYYMMKTVIADMKSAIDDYEVLEVLSNYFSDGFSYASLGNSDAGTNGICVAQNHTLTICNSSYNKTQTADFKTWLSTHNTIVYYVLSTPTFTEITDTTLIQQLENWRNSKSYQGQTNISQTNEDKPFIISYTTLKDVYSELDSRLKALEG